MEEKIREIKSKQFYKYLGQRIKYFRILNDYTQVFIGDVLGVTFQQIQKYESGVNNIPMDKLMMLTKVFHLSLKDLMGEVFPNVKIKYSNEFLKTLCFAKKLKDSKIYERFEHLDK